ncbi:PKD/Chitinase domain containing protein [uncultured Caudovirales phage]|uniref:PKD/Chitinase domain containing protein n=1 Tax=uncultured Caudovirales phage TaxID=2100421 RepID=A0A6J5QGZ5_9CAUD|nr:PKD/Chitinase domain containing protein [uncultured Caudovirales phage]CAB4169119.1 PKD/Chitinase domain containing protein [uncultured Caudovirales phage]CAB4180771.1 PKD/Chitinase domain containing protein [uncultured Caudovirales phage]CAB4195881.1 PKD/Chitinase domain containing protein [uncultured Caudovirales phage]CAB4221884.1 PKD/Chitinase domain containing protein [uncultured Caudovirales phage]
MKTLLSLWLLVASLTASAAVPLPVAVSGNAINLSMTANRVTGVSPLGVVFDATATTASTTSNPFHDIEYRWNFGDTNAGTYTVGAPGQTNKNIATGAVAGHVFEITEGSGTQTFTVTLTAYDGTNTVTQTKTITVTDPASVYSGTATVCLANSTPTAGVGSCPAGAATPAGASVFDTAMANCTANKRCLFKKGDTWTMATAYLPLTAANVSIGAYGTGSKPLITASSGVGGVFTISDGADNMRIADIEVTGVVTPGALNNAILVVGYPVSNLLVLRTTFHNSGGGLVIVSGARLVGVVIADSAWYDFYSSIGYFGETYTAAIIGNTIGPIPESGNAEHGVRIQNGRTIAVANNTFEPANTAAGKQQLTVRSRDHSVGQAYDPYTDTRYIHVSDNKFNAGGQAKVQFAPASYTQCDWGRDVVFERNWTTYSNYASTSVGLSVEWEYVTIRNNIWDSSASLNTLSSPTSISIVNGQGVGTYCTATVAPSDVIDNRIPAPSNIWIYNNTFYSSVAPPSHDRDYFAISVNNGDPSTTRPVANVTIKNNLVYVPGYDYRTFFAYVIGASTIASTTLSNNSTGSNTSAGGGGSNQMYFTNPNFTSLSPFTPANAKPVSGCSSGIGGCPIAGGVAVPVWSDFFLVAQPATRDMGAVIH